MAFKEREKQPVIRNIIRHGPNKGRVDMSSDSSQVKIPGGGEVDVYGLLKEIGQKQPSQQKKRHYKKSL